MLCMCLTSLSKCEPYKIRDSLVDLGVSSVYITGCHIALHKCFMNQCLRVDLLKSIRFIPCGPGGIKDEETS